MSEKAHDRYASFDELTRYESEGRDYRIVIIKRAGSSVAILAPHGGRIEPGTSEIAHQIAANDLSLYAFEGIKPKNNRILHITSSRFDEPKCLQLIRNVQWSVAIHGCKGPDSRICVGGLDKQLAMLIYNELTADNLPALVNGHKFHATHPMNICNRTSRGCGVQLEISPDIRRAAYQERIAQAIRRGLTARNNLPEIK